MYLALSGGFKLKPVNVRLWDNSPFMSRFETTAHALSYVTFVLAKYPDIQDKVRQEVEDYLADGVSIFTITYHILPGA